MMAAERKIGSARARRYDLDLDKSRGSRNLALMIGLMTFLSVLAVAAFFALSALSDRWTSGLENKLTVEILAESAPGKTRPRREVAALSETVRQKLSALDYVENVHVLQDSEITDLVRPWLGSDLPLDRIPLPGLVSVSLKDGGQERYDELKRAVQDIAPGIRVDTHDEWLSHLLRFTRALRFAAVLMAAVIGATTVIAVAGAVQGRLAIHADDVEILHLMGAYDGYIARQFQHHTFFLSLRGSYAGFAFACGALFLTGLIYGRMDIGLLPDFSLDAGDYAALAALPLGLSVIAMLTARWTVFSVLSRLL